MITVTIYINLRCYEYFALTTFTALVVTVLSKKTGESSFDFSIPVKLHVYWFLTDSCIHLLLDLGCHYVFRKSSSSLPWSQWWLQSLAAGSMTVPVLPSNRPSVWRVSLDSWAQSFGRRSDWWSCPPSNSAPIQRTASGCSECSDHSHQWSADWYASSDWTPRICPPIGRSDLDNRCRSHLCDRQQCDHMGRIRRCWWSPWEWSSRELDIHQIPNI